MQFTLPALLTLFLAAGASAKWHMDVAYSDGTNLKFDGHTNSGCSKFEKANSDITGVDFDSNVFTDTFKLYTDGDCNDLGYEGHKGNNNIPNEQYGSYKVY